MNNKLKEYSQKLRREMTDEEKHLWYDFLKKLPVTINRQKIIGYYIVDFYIACARLVIELDGLQHYEDDAKEYDKKRDRFLSDLGIKVLRYPNVEFNVKFEGVCRDIVNNINERSNANIVL